jgi:outer membrane protein TolC
VLPIDLETIFRLAEEHNAQIGLARERVSEAFAEKDVAATKWLPDLYVGTNYFRHEGGIQNFDGTFLRSSYGALFAGLDLHGQLDFREALIQQVNAARNVWQQKGELTRIATETLLEAGNAFIDLLAVHEGQAIARQDEAKVKKELDRLEKVKEDIRDYEVSKARLLGEQKGLEQAMARLDEQRAAASAKLAYLIGVDPHTQLVPVCQVKRLELVDISPPLDELVAQALTLGPGVHEMEQLLATIQDGLAQADGPTKWLPILEVCTDEGAFGARPNASLTWDNRWDFRVQARWNLTEYVTLRQRKRVAESKLNQAHLAYQDLRGKLVAGVQEARDTIGHGARQIDLGEQQLKRLDEVSDLAGKRLENRVEGSSSLEVFLANQAYSSAQTNYVQALRAYNKAQLRLLLLLGRAACPPRGPGHP